MGLLAFFKKNRIKILKILITLSVIYFLVCVVFQIVSVLFDDVYNIITLTYILIIAICNLLSEFSPYILHNHLLFIFPFLANYSGRGALYILIGIVSISPELNKYLNYSGYIFIGLGIICIWLNWVLAKNVQTEYQDFMVMKDNYQDFSEDSQKNSMTFPNLQVDYNNIDNKNMKINDNNEHTFMKNNESNNENNNYNIIKPGEKVEMTNI